MPTRFYVKGTKVRMVDVDPQYQASANQTNIEFALHGHLIAGHLRPGMLANIRPHLRRGKYYRVISVSEYDPSADMAMLRRTKMPERIRSQLMSMEELFKVTYELQFICADRNEFEELIKMDIGKEEIELFDDLE